MVDPYHEKMWEGFVSDCIQMPCTVKYTGVEAAKIAEKKQVGLVGTKASLEALAASNALPAALGAVLKKQLAKLLDESKPQQQKQTKLATRSVFVDSCGDIEEVTVGCVPNDVTRHLSPHRPDQVLAFAKEIKPGPDSILVLAAPNADAVFAYSAAAARAHPLCQLKGENDAFDAKREALATAVWTPEGEVSAAQREKLQIVAESIQLTARLVDTPTNYLNTKTYAEIAQGIAKRVGLKCKVLVGEELQKEGMHVFHSVGRAGEYPPTLVVLSHEPENPESDEVVAWCGKGVVYDTGGLSLKTPAGMKVMKRDMGGSAGVIGAVVAAARLGVKTNLHAFLGLVDNAVSSQSLRVDDVVRCLSGRTIEVLNTDAEGRLVLCDTVAYAQKYYKPTTLVDMATLTGAQGVATGQHFAAVCSNDEDLENAARAAGKETGDQVFPVPFAPELLLKEYESKVADMTNLGKSGALNASVSTAGLFIYEAGFAGKYEGKWLHVDMAFPVENDSRGTGWGVSLLLKLVGGI